MSAEFKVGQQVSGDDYKRLPVGAQAVWKHCADSDGLSAEKTETGWWREGEGPSAPMRSDAEMSLPRTITYLPDAPEPEDTDDVEPEPLKKGDWVQVWAKVHDPSPKNDELVELRIRIRGGGMATAYTTDDAIVRPDAGQVPPWVKPTRCTSLLAVEDGERLLRCARDEHGAEVYHWNDAVETWADAEAYGRVEVRS